MASARSPGKSTGAAPARSSSTPASSRTTPRPWKRTQPCPSASIRWPPPAAHCTALFERYIRNDSAPSFLLASLKAHGRRPVGGDPRMYFQMAKRLLLETDKRLLWKLAWNMGVKGVLSVERHKRRLRRGEVFPPFLYVSIINSCNLRCQGCWVDVAAKMEAMEPAAFHKLVREAKEMGNVFFGIV